MKSSFSILAASFWLLISSPAFAGSAQADINCKSDGLTLKGNIPGDSADFDVTIRQAGKSSRFYNGNSNGTVVQSLKDGVYTIVTHPPVEPTSIAFIEMFAIPKTVVFKSVSSGYTATFSAKLSFTHFNTGDIVDKTIRCTMKYSL